MKLREYEHWVEDRATQDLNKGDGVYNFIGLAGETGEVMEWLKKAYYRKDPNFTEEDLMSELGDVLHYLVRIARHRGWTLKEIINYNVQKIEQRQLKG